MVSNYGQRIKELREERGLSLMALAKEIGVSDTAICKWENRVTEPKLSYIVRLADFFNCTTDFLTGRSDDLGWVAQPSMPKEETRLSEIFRDLSPQMKELAMQTLQFWKTIKNL